MAKFAQSQRPIAGALGAFLRLFVISSILFVAQDMLLRIPPIRNIVMAICPFGTEVWISTDDPSLKLEQATFAGKPLLFSGGNCIFCAPDGRHVLSYKLNGNAYAEIIHVTGDELYITIGKNGVIKE